MDEIEKPYIYSAHYGGEDDGKSTVIDTEFELSFLDRNGSPLVKQWNKSLFGPKDILGFSKFLELKDVLVKKKNDFLEEGTLTACCNMSRIATEIRGTSTCLGRSRLGMEHMSHQWIIKEFKTLNLGVEKTLLIQTTSKQVPSLSMSLFLDGGQIQIEITQDEDCASNMCYCKISLIDIEKNAPFSTQDQHWFCSYKKKKDVWRFPIFLSKNKLMANKALYLPNDSLTLRFEWNIESGIASSQIESYEYIAGSTVQSILATVNPIDYDSEKLSSTSCKSTYRSEKHIN
ncbi:MATH domain-containing protein [Caerostris darwini]|uniref:MATH domain-containing protein n=1 Tax=Caerostris darwini TaxID=1538125 RepID=A0AAV4WWA2_9ARAC|nr:MATH domain-containing protein [Caerostris darwini]